MQMEPEEEQTPTIHEEEPTPRIRNTVFPMPIVNNAQEFARNHRFGAPRRGALGRGTPRNGRIETSGQPPSPSSSRPTITRSIYVLPQGTIWIDKGGDTLPLVESWPLDNPTVHVSLPNSTKWEGLVHPFPIGSVEHGIALAFSRAIPQATPNLYTGLFYKRSKKRKGVGNERGFYLEPYFRVQGAFFGSLAANTYLVYCPDSTILPQGAVDTYMRRLEVGPSTSRTVPLSLPLTVPATSSRETSAPTVRETSTAAVCARPSRETSTPVIPATPLMATSISTGSATPYRPTSISAVPTIVSPTAPARIQARVTRNQLALDNASTSMSSVIDLTYTREIEDVDADYIFFTEEWIKSEEAYYDALRRRSSKPCDLKLNHKHADDIAKEQAFWLAIKELETTTLQDPTPSLGVLQTIRETLIQCRDKKMGISCSENDLIRITTHPAMSMYTAADVRQHFALAARPFWQEWAEFEKMIQLLPKNSPCKTLALSILCSYGEQGQENIDKLEELFNLPSNSKLSKSLLQLMCQTQGTPSELEEEELFHRRKAVEEALYEFQSFFLKFKIFRSFQLFLESSNSIPECHIKVMK